MLKEVDKIFVGQPLDLGGGGLDPPRPPKPSGYFELPMMNPSRSPLPPKRPYRRPLNYLEYVKDVDPNAHVRVFKVAIRTNDVEIVNLFNFTFKNNVSNWCNNYIEDYLDSTFVELQLTFYKRYIKVLNDE
jgi:hypothetical protein